MNFIKVFTISIMILIIFTSCSGGAKTPVSSDSPLPNYPEMLGAPSEDTNRNVLSVYDAVIDSGAKTFTVTPVQRVGTYHFPLSQYFPNVLQITGYGFTPNFWADIKLRHPFPGSGIDAFDPRVIAILPANSGVSFNYPVFNCVGNNSVVMEPDGYTKLFDNIGGSIPGNTNPFKAYFKDQPYRVWSSTGVTQETQRWQMNLSGFGGSIQFKLVVDVSTNYPNPPTPITDNAPEPVEIDAIVGQELTNEGGSADITVTLLDWQDRLSVGSVLVEAPDLFSGTISLSYSTPGPNPNEYIYTGTISNEKLAPEGEYKYLVATWDQSTGIYIYNEFSVSVIYIIPEGNLVWAKRAGGSFFDDAGVEITTLSDNSTVVTGSFYYSATFGPGEPNETVLTSATEGVFIAKYNPDGTLSWAKQPADGAEMGYVHSYGITTLLDNSTVVTGTFNGSVTFGMGDPNETVLTGSFDIFIARYNPDGTLAWVKSASGGGEDYSEGITALSDNSTVVTGYFNGMITFGPGEPNQTVIMTFGNSDIFIAQYNPNGKLAWARSAGGLSDDRGYGITTLSNNSAVVTGCFKGSATFGSIEPNQTILTSNGDFDIFIARYNPNGTLAWAKRAGGVELDESIGITTLSDDSIVATGYFSGLAPFGEDDPNGTSLISAGYYDIFNARYNSDGTFVWAKRAGGLSADKCFGITTLSDNSIVETGWFSGLAIFGPGEANETFLASAGGYDIFIARYNPNGTLSWVKRAGGSNIEVGYGITTLSDNSTVVTGYFQDSVFFGPNETNETVLTSDGYKDIFVARFEP